MTVFSFPYREETRRDGVLIFRPSVEIELQGTDGIWSRVRLYPDAGADMTLLRPTDCQVLGYDLEAGELRLVSGVCSGLIRTFLHMVPLRLGPEEFPCRVAFAETAAVPRLLGREGVFQRFKVCYDDVNRVTEFILPGTR